MNLKVEQEQEQERHLRIMLYLGMIILVECREKKESCVVTSVLSTRHPCSRWMQTELQTDDCVWCQNAGFKYGARLQTQAPPQT